MKNGSEKREISIWDKISTTSNLISAVLIPIVLGYIGNSVSLALKESDVDLKLVELAVDVLKQEPEQGDSSLRIWAIAVLNEKSPIPIETKVQESLVKRPILSPMINPSPRTRLEYPRISDNETREGVFILSVLNGAGDPIDKFRLTMNGLYKGEFPKQYSATLKYGLHNFDVTYPKHGRVISDLIIDRDTVYQSVMLLRLED